MSRLPSFEYQYRLDYNSNFNNQLLRGHNQGLSLYDYDQDTKLYKNLDTSLISTRNINFDKINNELDEKSNIFQQGKQFINGIVEQINNVSNETEKNINKISILPEYKLLGILIIGLLILKK